MMASMRSALRFVVAALLLLVVAACAVPMPAATEGSMHADAAAGMAAEEPLAPVPGEVTVEVARARPAPLEGGNGGAYFTLLNGTDQPVRLLSAASDVAAHVELHETVDEGGVMKMIPQLDGFEIPAGGSVILQPGGKHVMLLGLVKPLAEGDAFTLTLTFDNDLVLDLDVPVVAMTGMPGMHAMGEGATMTDTHAMTATEMMTGTQP